MIIYKCDICKKVIRERQKITRLELPGFSLHYFCKNCAKKCLKTVTRKLKKKVGIKFRSGTSKV